ncbi:hypothetical protein ABB37_09484 [Leptomonas pyrrhocoris]|uniref:Uncharacterized protein n=1 Tax=Leptomonas pyrrhocoris TaxID=157538 RepID=A0A0N0VCU0_LEPPY|nr:hypothetical protein ABB37_09484 [Leptomonas pyrrhocoris]KPA73844.1 hypothetical protein ABB37_09484 [Leptomonas pyrrhocoris]|eukprot:XP_015652283.1 hypothetical protein ABB37_09484 [Leptomonas pyrrhocoris]
MSPSLDSIRSRQTNTLLELRPIVQDLEEAIRDALISWKQFAKALENVAQLYDQYASFIPTAGNAGEVGLDASLGVTAEIVKACKTLKQTTNLWSQSDEVVDLRAQLYAEWCVWRRTERRLAKVVDVAVERRQQTQKLRDMQKSVEALARKKSTPEVDRAVKSLQCEMKTAEDSVKSKDVAIASDFKAVLKKSLLREGGGAAKTGYALRNAGRGLMKAFEGFSNMAAVSAATPAISRTPVMGVPLEIDFRASQRAQPATPASTEAEYGHGFPYALSESPLNVISFGARRISIAA